MAESNTNGVGRSDNRIDIIKEQGVLLRKLKDWFSMNHSAAYEKVRLIDKIDCLVCFFAVDFEIIVLCFLVLYRISTIIDTIDVIQFTYSLSIFHVFSILNSYFYSFYFSISRK